MAAPLRCAAGVALLLLLTGWTALGALPAARALATARESPVVEQARRLLRRPSANCEDLIGSLIALGPEAIEPAIDALRDEFVPASDGHSQARLAPETLVAVRKALTGLERTRVIASLRGRVARSADAGDRKVVIKLLGILGSTEELDLLVEAATPPAAGDGFDSKVALVAQRSLEQIFRRQPSAIECAARRLSSAHEDVASVLAGAIVSSASPASFDLLAPSLGVRPALDLVVIPILAKANGRCTSLQRDRVLEAVRADLWSSNPMLARAATMACGEFGDPLSASALCNLLEHTDAQLAAAAHASLKRLSGLGFAAQRVRWQQWLQAEESWYQAEAEFEVDQLQSSIEEDVLQSLQTLLLHPLYRETFAPSVASVTSRSEPGLRCLACTVLGRWRSPASIPVLRALARDSSPDVANAATDALRSIDSSLSASK